MYKTSIFPVRNTISFSQLDVPFENGVFEVKDNQFFHVSSDNIHSDPGTVCFFINTTLESSYLKNLMEQTML